MPSPPVSSPSARPKLSKRPESLVRLHTMTSSSQPLMRRGSERLDRVVEVNSDPTREPTPLDSYFSIPPSVGIQSPFAGSTRHRRSNSGSIHIQMQTLRPDVIRALHASEMPAVPHGIGMNPARTDFFVTASEGHQSTVPLWQLAAVVVGRVILALSLGGISTGFVPNPPVAPGLKPPPSANDPDGPDATGHGVNPRILAASAGGVALGTFITALGLGCFAKDTWAVNPRRAAFMATISSIGVIGVAGGGILYILGEDRNSFLTRWLACIPRSIGNFCVFYALPNAFATSEIVNGRAPIRNREQTRQLMFAAGGAMMMFWAHISSPGLDAPLFAREMAQSAALVGLCIGAALARSDSLRLEAESRAYIERRGSSMMPVTGHSPDVTDVPPDNRPGPPD